MPYSSWTTKSTTDTIAAADVNLLADTIYTYVKGGLSTVQPVKTLDTMPRGEIRQTVLYASVSSSDGRPNYLTKGSSNEITLNADASTTVVVSFANGINEYLVQWSSNVGPTGWQGLSTNGTWYLYVTYYSSDGQSSYGVSSLAPNYYSAKDSTAATANRHQFVIPKMKMYYDDGSTWTNLNRVFVGEVEVTTGGVSTNSTTVRNYALKGMYRWGWTAVSSGLNSQVFHNLGVPMSQGVSFSPYFSTYASTQDVHHSFMHDFYYGAVVVSYYPREVSTSYDTRNYIKFGFETYIQFWKGSTLTSGYMDFWMKRKW